MNRIYKFIPLCIACLYPSVAMAHYEDYSGFAAFICAYLWTFVEVFSLIFLTLLPFFGLKRKLRHFEGNYSGRGIKILLSINTFIDTICIIISFFYILTLLDHPFGDPLLFFLILVIPSLVIVLIKFLLYKKMWKMMAASVKLLPYIAKRVLVFILILVALYIGFRFF